MSENSDLNENINILPSAPPAPATIENIDTLFRALIERSTNDILNIPLNQTINIQPQPFPSNISMPAAGNPMNSPAFMGMFGPMHFMSGLNTTQGYGDILQRSMLDTGGAAKPTAKDTIDNLSIVEVFSDRIQCAICQETIKNGAKAIKLPCPDAPHYFCLGDEPEKCAGIKPWLEENNTCPICRFELPIEEKPEKKVNVNEPPPLEQLDATEEQPQPQPQPPPPLPPPAPENINDNLNNEAFRNMIRDLIQEETSYVDDDGFDTREFEEAIQRSMDDSPTNAPATAQAASDGDLNAMREMRLQRLEQEQDEKNSSEISETI